MARYRTLFVAILALGALASRASAVRLTSVLVLAGDSIGEGGSGGDARDSLGHLLENYSQGRWLVLNHSYGGQALLGNAYNGRKPDPFEIWATGAIPVVELGTNDWSLGEPLSKFSSAYGAFLDGVRPSRDAAYCITPIWRSNEQEANAIGLYLQDYRDAIAAVCQERGAVVIDGRLLVPPDPAYFNDGLHPNARGFRVMARALKDTLQRTLPRAVPDTP